MINRDNRVTAAAVATGAGVVTGAAEGNFAFQVERDQEREGEVQHEVSVSRSEELLAAGRR